MNATAGLKFFRRALIAVAIGTATQASAGDLLKQAQEKLQGSFSNLSITDFGPGPIDGLYEVNTGGKIIYYSPDKELLFFGEIFTKDGRSLTKEKVALQQNKKAKEIPLEAALKIGNGPKTIVEFTDPECPFCQRYHTFIKANKNVTRYVFFTPLRQIHPESARKAVHILCATDKTKAFNEMYDGKVAPASMKQCAAGTELLAKHEEISRQFGVSGTPTLVLGANSVVSGFDQAQIAQYLASNSQ